VAHPDQLLRGAPRRTAVPDAVWINPSLFLLITKANFLRHDVKLFNLGGIGKQGGGLCHKGCCNFSGEVRFAASCFAESIKYGTRGYQPLLLQAVGRPAEI
jgi:hypothetical protein